MPGRWFSRKPPLKGAPPQLRVKTYAAESGYVYSYRYLGWREGRGEWEFVFCAWAAAGSERNVSATLAKSAAERWESERGRELAEVERYAFAKLSLLRALDIASAPSRVPERVSVTAAMLDEFSATLGLDG